MSLENETAYEDWFDKLDNKEIFLPHKEMMRVAWLEAIKYEQLKPLRTFRWNGVIE
jgi:hypothetical protein